MVAIFIDESGSFTSSRPYSVVSALTLPHSSLDPTRQMLTRLTADWPRVNGELKGGQLSNHHLRNLVDGLFRKHAVLHSTVSYIGESHAPIIAVHQAEQCERLTKYLTAEHMPALKEQVWGLRRVLEAMSPQLYVQCTAQTELICTILEDIPNYFAQRLSAELAKFEWFIDAKDKAVTPQEDWWRSTLGALIESRSRRHPFQRLDILPTADYSHFDRQYDLTKDTWHPYEPSRTVTGTSIRKVLTDHLHFVNSKADILIQAVDILGRFVRRAVEGQISAAGTIDLIGRLQLQRKAKSGFQSVQFISLAHEELPEDRRLVSILDRMTLAARPILTRMSVEALDQLPRDA